MYLVTAFYIIILDQISKYVSNDGALLNKGIAFGYFSNNQLGVVLILWLGLTVLYYFFWRVRSKQTIVSKLGWTLLIAGIVSNSVSRIIQGSITDYIVLYPNVPAFNLADASIVLGVTLIALEMKHLRIHKRDSVLLSSSSSSKSSSKSSKSKVSKPTAWVNS